MFCYSVLSPELASAQEAALLGEEISASPITESRKATLFGISWKEQPAGRGSFGSVYRGMWQGQHVALKLLSPHNRPEKVLKVSIILFPELRKHVFRCFNDMCFSALLASRRSGVAVENIQTFYRSSAHSLIPMMMIQCTWSHHGKRTGISKRSSALIRPQTGQI